MKSNVKLIGVLALLISVAGCSSLGRTKEKDYELTLIHVNDVHGRAEESKFDGVGYAKVSTIAKNYQADKNNGEVLILDAGDTLH
ncbi:MAG: bifunctional metallophosphatase/5'-nucleotidase, partial [Cetobacterium sp.]